MSGETVVGLEIGWRCFPLWATMQISRSWAKCTEPFMSESWTASPRSAPPIVDARYDASALVSDDGVPCRLTSPHYPLTTTHYPLVSVIVPSWNCGPYLKRCVESQLAQTVRSKIVVVDDGSTACGFFPACCDLGLSHDLQVTMLRHRSRCQAASSRRTPKAGRSVRTLNSALSTLELGKRDVLL
jgi:hypothetical protein